MVDCFNPEIAVRYGLNAAIVINLIYKLQRVPHSDDIFKIGSKVFVNGSVVKLKKDLPYLGSRQISNALALLVNEGILERTFLQSDVYNRTYWYCLIKDII